ncbi:MAG: orotate phosphoribosyltransferase, partial [Sulfolobales archaeon]|nr:orotate phosphoribosyltransferase [Sulfolobales archaeon]
MGIAVELLHKGMLLIGTFKLTSGRESPYYLDLRRLPSYPELFNQVVNEAIELLKGVD